MAVSYKIPGLVHVIRQPTSLICWATAYTMMRCWKDQSNYDIRSAVALVDERYGVMVDGNRALPTAEFTVFLKKAGMQREPMWSLPMGEWLALLRHHGLLWVGTLGVVSPGTYLHSRLVEGLRGDGTSNGTWVNIIDPENGRRYNERFGDFVRRYEDAFSLSQRGSRFVREYFQIRYFP